MKLRARFLFVQRKQPEIGLQELNILSFPIKKWRECTHFSSKDTVSIQGILSGVGGCFGFRFGLVSLKQTKPKTSGFFFFFFFEVLTSVLIS